MDFVLRDIITDIFSEVTRLEIRVNSLTELLLSYPNGFDFTLRTGASASIYKLENNNRIIIGIMESGNLIMFSYEFHLFDSIFSVLLATQ